MKETSQRPMGAAITQLRAEIEALPKDNGGKRQGIPVELKRRIADALSGSDMPIAEFSTAVAVSLSAVTNWRKRFGARKDGKALNKKVERRKAGFKRMTVVEDVAANHGSFAIEGPNGLRMTGLGADDVARLWRALC